MLFFNKIVSHLIRKNKHVINSALDGVIVTNQNVEPCLNIHEVYRNSTASVINGNESVYTIIICLSCD